MTYLDSYDEFDEAEVERFSKRKDRRKLHGKRSVTELFDDAPESSASKFSDPHLQALYERGFIHDILGTVKSGKEATVYLAQGPRGLCAAKVYSDLRVRSFKNDGVYRAGRYIKNARARKAVEQRSSTGIDIQQALWVGQEYAELWHFFREGLPVPEPLVGPESSDIDMAGQVVLMRYLGDADAPAPRLSDLRLEGEEAWDAFGQSLKILEAMLRLGKVHGDYSTYNLLYWQGKVYVIDLPQVSDLHHNPNGWALLERDVASLCQSFRRHGVEAEPAELMHRLRPHAR